MSTRNMYSSDNNGKLFQRRPGELPGGNERGPLTDTTTWPDINRVAEMIVNECVLGNRMRLWEVTGMQHNDYKFPLPNKYLIRKPNNDLNSCSS